MKNNVNINLGFLFNPLVFILILISCTAFGQMHKFPLQNSNFGHGTSFLLSAPNNQQLYFWYEGVTLQQSRSTDNGSNWGTAVKLADTLTDADSVRDINCFATITGRILLIYHNAFYYLKYSDNNGLSWSSPVRLVTGINLINARNPYAGIFSQSASGKIFLTYSKYAGTIKNVSYIASTDNGLTWSSESAILSGPNFGSIVPLNGSNLILLYQNYGLYKTLSTDDGLTWSNPEAVLNDSSVSAPRAVKDQSGKIWLVYIKTVPTPFNNITQTDIIYKTSTDNGLTWSAELNFTRFKGIDKYFSISNNGNNPLISFVSDRYNTSTIPSVFIWYGSAGLVDDDAPPYLYKYNIAYLVPPIQTPDKFNLYIDFNSTLSSAKLITYLNGSTIDSIVLHDDGLMEDSIANDKIYSASVPGLNYGQYLNVYFKLQDSQGHTISYFGPTISMPVDNRTTTKLIDVNNFSLPIDNSGILGDVSILGALAGGKYDNKIVLFSGGFYMTGITNGFLWANAMASASRILDYIPGKVGSPSYDPNIMYVVNSSDPPFGQSWQDWKFPVSEGADYYDGNKDNTYNPVDLNGNGFWDPDEDRPASFSDINAWCIYNDGLAQNRRTYSDVPPQGIEIQQTVFAKKTTKGDLANVIFVNYKITNTGTVSDVLDSVYFSPYSDPDIGEGGVYDLDGCDTLLNAGYTYHSLASPDGKFGTTPPALFLAALQGPQSYIPGTTFWDTNLNGIYDEGVDIPLDTAYSHNGILGIKKYPGAKNLSLSSFTQYYNGIDPANRSQARFYTTGKNNLGLYNNPCTLLDGTVYGVDCSKVNPLFTYSGDPVKSLGWINTYPRDQRFISNYGPFRLLKNKPVDIKVAYIVGRGTDALNSISVARGITKTAINYYNANFDSTFTSVLDKNNIVKSFSLEQNYPNPFNPNTIIIYSLPVDSRIKLIIYNSIGQVVKVLANQNQTSGTHEINFNASSLSSGVYFYTIQTNSLNGKQNYTSTKKMILLK